MLLLAVVIAPFKALWLVFMFLLRHKALIFIGGILVIGFFVWSHFSQGNKPAQQVNIPHYQAIAPSKEMAPRVIQTQTRIYYESQSKQDNSNYTLTVWWDYNKDTWQKHETPLPLKKSEIKVINR